MLKIMLFWLLCCSVGQAQDIPTIYSISNEDNGTAASHYVTLTIYFEDARIPAETITISRKDMDSEANMEYVIKELTKRFKER